MFDINNREGVSNIKSAGLPELKRTRMKTLLNIQFKGTVVCLLF